MVCKQRTSSIKDKKTVTKKSKLVHSLKIKTSQEHQLTDLNPMLSSYRSQTKPINSFNATGLFLYPLKTSKNLRYKGDQ